MLVILGGPHQGSVKGHGIVRLEGEAVALTGGRIKVLDGVGQAAGRAYHGHTAVAHGDHLPQAAGFKARGHEEHVRPGVDALGQGSVESQEDSHLVRMTAGQVAEQIMVMLLAGA